MGFGRLCLQTHKRHHTECCTFTFLQSNGFMCSHQDHYVVPLHAPTPQFSILQHFLEDGLAWVVQFCDHLGAVI